MEWEIGNLSKSPAMAGAVHRGDAARRASNAIVAHLLSPIFRAALFLASIPSKCARCGCYGAPLLPSPTLPPFRPSPPLSSLLHSVSPCCKRLQVSVQACSARLCLLPPPSLSPSLPSFLPPHFPLLLPSLHPTPPLFLSPSPSSSCFDRSRLAAHPALSIPSLKCARTLAARVHPQARVYPPSFS